MRHKSITTALSGLSVGDEDLTGYMSYGLEQLARIAGDREAPAKEQRLSAIALFMLSVEAKETVEMETEVEVEK
jgi:hypothetical protein